MSSGSQKLAIKQNNATGIYGIAPVAFYYSTAESAWCWSYTNYLSASTASFVSLSQAAWSPAISSSSPLSLAAASASSASTYSFNSLVAACPLSAT